MSIYPNTGSALIGAFNPSLYETYKGSGWQKMASELCDKYPEADDHESGLNVGMSQNDWASQSGMVTHLLRENISNLYFCALRIRYTFDGELLRQRTDIQVRINMTENLRKAITLGWPTLEGAIMIDPRIPAGVRENKIKREYLCLRALRPDVLADTLKAVGSEAQQNINNQQCKINKIVNQIVESAYISAREILSNAGLIGVSGK